MSTDMETAIRDAATVTTADIAAAINKSAETVKYHIRDMVKKGNLQRPARRGVWSVSEAQRIAEYCLHHARKKCVNVKG